MFIAPADTFCMHTLYKRFNLVHYRCLSEVEAEIVNKGLYNRDYYLII